MKFPDSFITIDPGLYTGLVCWKGRTIHSYKTFHGGPNRSFHEKVDSIVAQIHKWNAEECGFHPERIYIEWPAVFSSPAGMTVARSGSVVKLSFMVGRLAQLFSHAFYNADMQFIEVSKWKGQVPKDIMHKRIRKLLTDRQKVQLAEKKYGHVMDAIGMGLHLLGKL